MGSADDFLNPGDSYPAIKLKEVGDSVVGVIENIPDEPISRKSIDGDKEELTLPVTLTVDGELRTLWVQKFELRKAIKAACAAVGEGVKLAVGGTIKVKLTKKEPVPGKPSPKSIFAAVYEPPAAVAASEADMDFGEEPF